MHDAHKRTERVQLHTMPLMYYAYDIDIVAVAC